MARNPKPFRQWMHRPRKFLGRPWPRPLEGKPLGFAVKVVEPLDSWVYMGGWGDGPWTLRVGAVIFLTHKDGGLIHYRPGVKPAPWSTGEGHFSDADVSMVRRLNGRQLLG